MDLAQILGIRVFLNGWLRVQQLIRRDDGGGDRLVGRVVRDDARAGAYIVGTNPTNTTRLAKSNFQLPLCRTPTISTSAVLNATKIWVPSLLA